jgi:hypothetical protein
MLIALGLGAATSVSAAEPQAAVNRHLLCVEDNVAKLDDGTMGVEELANRIIPICHDLHVAAMEATNGDVEAADVEKAHTVAAVLERDGIRFDVS